MIREFNGPSGRLEVLLDEPALGWDIGPTRQEDASRTAADTHVSSPPRVAVVLAHPLPTGGGTMHNKVVYQVAKSLCRTGAAVLRFNFRGVGTSAGTFDDGPGEMADFRAAIDVVAARYPGTEIWAAGFSFGSWIAMSVGATDDRVSALIGIAPPVGRYDFSAVTGTLKPKFFIQGNRDELCPYRETTKFYAQVPDPKELVVIDGADHLFDGKTADLGEAVEDLLGDYGVRSKTQL